MSNFTAVPSKAVGDVFSQSMWQDSIQQNLNYGVARPLADLILGSPTSVFDFTSIDAGFAHLLLVAYLRTSGTVTADQLVVRFNNDSAADYDYQRMTAANAALSSAALAAQTIGRGGVYPGASDGANRFGAVSILIPYYAGASNFKTYLAQSAAVDANAANSTLDTTSGVWRSASPINRVTLFTSTGSFTADSRVTLYGLPF